MMAACTHMHGPVRPPLGLFGRAKFSFNLVWFAIKRGLFVC
uniref:Uncharacterized protein n=1 Tax=Arundo donax TaxID=35708 RepID=A0A0A9EP79_ARUDO